MVDPRVALLEEQARKGHITRREMLTTGLRLGLATPAIASLMALAPVEGLAAPQAAGRLFLPRRQDGAGSTFTYLRDGGWPDLDPHSAYDNGAAALIWQIYDMLIQYKGSSTDEYDPMLAESWEASADNSTFTFKIHANALFHDGDPCTAQSVKSAFERFLLMERGPVNVIKRFVDDPAKIEVVDDLTVRFNLGTSQPLFLAAMASSYGPFVVNTKYVDEHKTEEDPWAYEWFRENAVGTGPYKLVENLPTERAVLQKFDSYYGGWDGDHFDQIVCRVVAESSTRRQLVETGEADATSQNLTPDDVEALRSNPNLQIVTYDSTAVYWAIMNVPRLKTKEVRQGFSYAFPYDEVMNAAYKGLIKRSGPLASTVRGADPDVFLYQTDLAKAKELILSGGFQEGDSFDYVFQTGDAVESTIAQLFQANVQQMGFNLEINEIERSALIDFIYGESPAEERPMFVGGWGWWPDYNDPWNQLTPNFSKASTGGGGSNGGYYVNDRYEELMAQVEHYTDEATMIEQMKEIQNILTEQDPPAIFYGQLLWYVVMRNDIQGFYGNPLYLNQYPFYQMSRSASS
jgi:peptide/nickel transport system substrate-binding protein